MLIYATDISQRYGMVLSGEYEKANIWPSFENYKEYINVLSEEIVESQEKMDELADLFLEAECYAEVAKSKKLEIRGIENIKGHAIGTICELLQVVAVCNKMLKQKEKEQ